MAEVMSEEQFIAANESDDEMQGFLSVYMRVPYALIYAESGEDATSIREELRKICLYYKIYKKGKRFNVEGTNGDYTPARLRYKMSASLINKEARFLFAEQPDITVEQKGDVSQTTPEVKRALTILNDLVKTILDRNNFSDMLVKAAKDCFIGKRVGCLVNFNEEDGVTLTFLPATQFVYEFSPTNHRMLTKFVSFTIMKDSTTLSEKRIFRKRYYVENGITYLEEDIFDGAAALIQHVTSKCEVALGFIPAVVFINDGLSEEFKGESEVETLSDFEEWYSKLANADSDAQRKSMNPTKYLVDMANNSTKDLSTAAGALWDLGSDQNLESPNVMVGLLEPKMSYSEALKVTLDRIKTSGYEQVDVPNITNESLSGVITTGKALKAIYWPLIVRCKEKMKMWGPQLSMVVDIIIKGAMIYPNTVKQYTNDIIEPVAYEIDVKQNTPLPEDEIEEKTADLAEVETNVMSRKSYMKKWRGLTNDEVQEELMQIALERQIIEDSSFSGTNNGMNGDNNVINDLQGDSFIQAGVNSLKRDGTQDSGTDEQIDDTGNQQVQQPDSSVISTTNTLNGTQISALINIFNSYKAGSFTKQQAKQLIVSMGFDSAFAEALLEDEEGLGGILSNA